jgi:GGDEF domain-containing protein
MRYATLERTTVVIIILAVLAMAGSMAWQRTDWVEIGGHLLMVPLIVVGLYRSRREAWAALALCFALYAVLRLSFRGGFGAKALGELLGIKLLVYLLLTVACAQVIRRLRPYFVRVESQDLLDEETGLGNGLALLKQLEEQVEEHLRYGHPFTLVIYEFDPGALERIRREKGRDILRDLAVSLLSRDIRSVDRAFRWGERVVLLLPFSDQAGARACLERHMEGIRGHLERSGLDLDARDLLSTRLVEYPRQAEEIDRIRRELGEVAGPPVRLSGG